MFHSISFIHRHAPVHRVAVRCVSYGLPLLTAFALSLAPAHADYKAKAMEATDFIQANYYDAKEKLYRPAVPVNPKDLPYDVMWGNGVQFTVLNGAAQVAPDRYKSVLYDFSQGIEKYWDKWAPLHGFDAYFSSPDGDDKYYDDNAWMVLAYCEAYNSTKDKTFLDWARKTQDFVLSGWDDKLGGGIYWYQNKKESKNTCINAPAAVSALKLYAISKDPKDLDWAKKLYKWTNDHLQDTDGLFWDNINLSGKIEKTKWTYNSALMIRANVELWRVSKDPAYLKEARRISDAALKRWVDPDTGGFADSARFNHLFSEAILETYDVTKDIKYLDAVRRSADFGYRYVRDAERGGYYNDWKVKNHNPDEHKSLIENASTARLFWLLTPYDDIEQLRAKANKAAAAGNAKAAMNYMQQVIHSTAGAAPIKAVTAATAAGTATTTG